MGTLKDWSTTASDNDDADITINWLEGQAPSTVNNSARAMMAALAAQYRAGTWHWVEKSSVSCSVASQTVFRLGSSGGDVTGDFHAGRHVRLTGGSATRYGYVVSSSFTSETTVTIGVDSGSLSGSMTTVALGPAVQDKVNGISGPIGDPPWGTYSLSLTAQAGTITSYTVQTARYRVVNRSVEFTIQATVTDNGTGSQLVRVSLPRAAVTSTVVIGRDDLVSGHTFSGLIRAGTTYAEVTKYDFSYPVTTNSVIYLSGRYEAV